MSEKEFLYQMRLKIFQEADKKEIPVTLLCKKHHVSRKWFYKWKKRRDKEGDEGLRPKIRAAPKMPNRVPKEIEEQILNFIKEYPTYGPERIKAELKSAGISVGHTGIYNVLKRKDLNTAKKRLEWVRKLSGEVVTPDEITRLKPGHFTLENIKKQIKDKEVMMEKNQQKPIDIKIGVKPVFSALIHSDDKEGPCRIGSPENLNPDVERENVKESFNNFKEELKEISTDDAEILDPVYIEYGESFVIPDSQFKEIEEELQKIDLFLLAYRVPGIEKYNKPISMIGKGVSNVDIAAYLRSRGLEGYAPLDFDEMNELISLLKVRKAIRETKILIVCDGEIITWGVVSNIWNLEDLKCRYGIGSKCVSFKTFYDEMDKVDKKEAENISSQLIKGAENIYMDKDMVTKSVISYMATKSLMKKYECNAFTIPCFELCVTKVPAERKFTPCLTHALLRSEGYPAACEGDLNVLLAHMLLMYISKKSTYMGNPWMEEENILHIAHDQASLKMKGLNEPNLTYEIRPFTYGGWGAVFRYDFKKDKGQQVTLARFDPTATKLLITKGEIVGGESKGKGCSGMNVDIKIPNVREFIHKQADFGHHLAMVYGDYTQKLKKLANIMKFEIVEHNE